MKFVYGRQDMTTLSRAEEHGFLLANGLGGYCSMTAAFSAPRCDMGVLVSSVTAPNERAALVHRLRETMTVGDERAYLSTQQFADGTSAEDGYLHLSSCVVEHGVRWVYDALGVHVTREIAVGRGENAVAVIYTVENDADKPCVLGIMPMCKMGLREDARRAKADLTYARGWVRGGGYAVHVQSENAQLWPMTPIWETLAYPQDAEDGRPEKGLTGACVRAQIRVLPGETARAALIFSDDGKERDAADMLRRQKEHMCAIEDGCGLRDEVAKQLALAADAYITRQDATGGKTIVAGYPLFGDWGRDTMIALPGCALATGRTEDAKSILRTFLAYEKDGLVPNLFPSDMDEPRYNTVDAALLLINTVYLYVRRTGDTDFAREAYPTMARIVEGYKRGTKHAIAMDDDGLISAGEGLDQVTWMDVCVNGILPTPRHGKPVEVNAYWYSALRVMQEFAALAGEDGAAYGELAALVKQSFVSKFYMEETGMLRDLVSGEPQDEQIRCNAVWAVTQPFTMLTPEQERRVVDTITRELYTPCGLRTLSPKDAEYHAVYAGGQVARDMAYHQGTAWVFPLGAYYLAYLKTRGCSAEAAARVREQLEAMGPMLREGCAGQLPEIYDGGAPGRGKGCFAQAWSVGEMLRVYAMLEAIEDGKIAARG